MRYVVNFGTIFLVVVVLYLLIHIYPIYYYKANIVTIENIANIANLYVVRIQLLIDRTRRFHRRPSRNPSYINGASRKNRTNDLWKNTAMKDWWSLVTYWTVTCRALLVRKKDTNIRPCIDSIKNYEGQICTA